MGPQITTHTTLLAKLASGADPDAWRLFSDRYSDLIHSFCRRFGLQPADGDEIAQEVLLALSKSMRNFKYDPGRGKFRSYLKTVVMHEIHRRVGQKPAHVLLDDVEGLCAEAPFDTAADAVWELEWRQYHLRMAMRQVELEFNSADLNAFRAYALSGQSAQETASSLGLSLDQVYQAKSRILKRVSDLIDEQVREEG